MRKKETVNSKARQAATACYMFFFKKGAFYNGFISTNQSLKIV
jgi:hypothetical protein